MDMVTADIPATARTTARCQAYLRSLGMDNEREISRIIGCALACNDDPAQAGCPPVERLRLLWEQWLTGAEPHRVNLQAPLALCQVRQALLQRKNQDPVAAPAPGERLAGAQFVAVPPEEPLEMPAQPLGDLHPLLRTAFWRRLLRRLRRGSRRRDETNGGTRG